MRLGGGFGRRLPPLQAARVDAVALALSDQGMRTPSSMPLPIILKGRNMPHSGNCFGGTVKLEVTGSPEAMGYCHCSSCRSWSGGPVNAFSLWKPEAVRITAGAEPEGINMMLLSPRLPRPRAPPRRARGSERAAAYLSFTIASVVFQY